jgi:4-hydroxybenzoate polyprenyltransferase
VTETPIATTDGLSPRRDRMWGWTGAVLGVAVGLASAAVAIFVEGANAFQSGPYPDFFTKRQLLAYDLFLGAVVAVGAVFGLAAMLSARRSPFPRTDALGGALVGTILMLLGASLLFTRLFAIVRGA